MSKQPERVEQRSYLAEFAQLLRTARVHAGLTVRELGAAINYSHTRIVRAGRGVQLPTWDLTSAYLTVCGVGGEALPGWRSLWLIARETDKELRRSPRLTAERGWFWDKVGRDWHAGVDAIRRPDTLVKVLRKLADPKQVANPEEIGVAITALASRSGSTTLRGIEARTGVPKTTLHGWLTGKRKPTAAQLDDLVEALGARPAERFAFAAAHKRVFGSVCGEQHAPSRLHCVLTEFHRGYHRTASGREWLETGDLDIAFNREYGRIPASQRLAAAQ